MVAPVFNPMAVSTAQEDDAAQRLSRMAAGNDNLVSQPGLVQALFMQNASPQQAQSIDQFLGGLNAEKMVRAASAAGNKIDLSPDQQSALDQMKVPYASVLLTRQDKLTALTTQMAQQGVRPVLGPDGQPQVDGNGNVQVEQIPKPKHKRAGLGRLLHDLGNNPVTSLIMTGKLNVNDPLALGSYGGSNGAIGGLEGSAQAANAGYQWASATFSAAAKNVGDPSQTPQSAAFGTNPDDADAMKRLGYDPTSFFSRQAYKARGLSHNDTSAARGTWDQANPQGLFGWDGGQAVTEAEVFSANPQKYRAQIENDPSLSPEQVSRKIAAISSRQFQDTVARVNASRASIGVDVANGLGIDPVKHSTAFNLTSAASDVLASFFIDPLSVGLGAYKGVQVASVAIKGSADANSIARILDKTTSFTGAAYKQQAYVDGMVSAGNQIREAASAGDKVTMAAIQARVDASNPFAALLPDFVGTNQAIRVMPPAEAANLKRGELPVVFGKGEPLNTYEKAVSHIVANNSLMRLQGGVAPVETTYMPGAMSSFGWNRVKGAKASWSATRSATKDLAAEDKYLSWAADPARAAAMFDAKTITRTIASPTDAVDVLAGHVIASPELADTGLASANRAQAGDVALTDAGRGEIRRNQLTYGRAVAPETKAGQVLAWATTGQLARMQVFAQRMRIFKNILPRDTKIDVMSASAGDAVTKTARLYMTPGQVNMLKARWTLGSGADRKVIVQGVKDQVAHAAGLPRTTAGQDLMAKWRTTDERYATDGNDISIDGNNVALFPGQVATDLALPNFGAVNAAAAKVGVYESTIGRLLSTNWMNLLLSQWKLGALATPTTALHANVEAWLNSAAEGLFGKGVQAKAMLKSTGTLTGPAGRTATMDRVASFAPIATYSRFQRWLVSGGVTPQDLTEMEYFGQHVMPEYMITQSAAHYANEIDPAGLLDIREAAEQGLTAKHVTYNPAQGWSSGLRTRTGFELTDAVDGLSGAGKYADALGQRVNRTPGVAKAMLDVIEHPHDYAETHVANAMAEPAAQRYADLMAYGTVYWTPDGVLQKAVTEADRTLGEQQWASRMTNEFKSLITGRNGVVNTKIASHIRATGTAPSQDWIHANVKGMHLPAEVLAPTYEPVVEGGVKGLVHALQDSEGKVYQLVVEKQIQRHSTGPLFGAAYLDAKKQLGSYKQGLLDAGFGDEAAQKITADIAAGQAWARISRMVDDPAVKSQMDITGRGFFAFSRATTMMMRRWGSTAWRNPVAARRLQLAGEGAVHSGLVYKDENGQWEFHFPGSGVAQEVLAHAASVIPGLHGFASFPRPADYTGSVTSMIPGSSNPFQYNTTPMVSIAGRTIANFFPDQRQIFDELDRKLNGGTGQGQGIVSTLTPSLIKRFAQLGPDGRNSMLSSAMVGSLYTLYAAGQVPKDGASPSEMDAFYGHLKQQTRSALFLRALFGLGSPASLGMPGLDSEWAKPDAAFAASGAQNLRDEFKRLLNDVNGDFGRANTIWAALHPDQTVYNSDGTVQSQHLYSVFSQSGSQSTTSKAVMPATDAALHWVQQNGSFIQKYKDVAAYFIPEQSAGDPFSMAAYRAQLETGLRERKTPQEFYEGVRISSAAAVYYAMSDKHKADVLAAKADGNTAAVSGFNTNWLAWSKDFKARNPLFGQHLETSVTNRLDAQRRLDDLRSMVQNGDVPDKAMVVPLTGMIQAYDGYESFIKAHPGGTTDARAQRSQAAAKLQDYLDAVTTANPGLTDVYRGIFRGVDSNLTDPTQGG